MRKYEIMFIVDAKVPEDGIDQINSQAASVVSDGGGRVEEIEKMGVRPRRSLSITFGRLPTASL
mgnify:CR=1 FL=1